jgi:lipopolysaccharide export system permease protein
MLAPSMLSRYIASRFLMAILSMFALCSLLVFMIDLVELLRQAGKHSDANVPGWMLVWLALLRLPAYTEILLPFGVLVGAISALLLLSRKSELAVMRAGGLSAWGFLAPGLVVAGILGLLSITVYNPMAAAARDEAEQLFLEQFGRKSNLFASGAGGTWLRQNGTDGQSVLNASYASEGGLNLKGVTAFVYDRDGRFSERVDAKEAQLKQGYWLLSKAIVSRVGLEPATFETYMLSTYLSPERVADALGTLISVSFWQLPDLIEVAEKAKLKTFGLQVQYEMLLARPLMCITMVLLAATVSLRSFRSGGIQTMVVAGMVGGFGFFLFAEISRQLGSAGVVPPWAAVWIPVFLAILLTLTVLLHQEDG